jgi:hypothetical protein
MKTTILTLICALSIAGGVAGQSPHKMTGTSMMAGQSKMMGEMKESDKKLDELVRQLNDAHDNDRIDRLVAVVNELVAERRQMREMMAMHGDMMRHMSSMSSTPPDASTPKDDHSAHHPEK